LAVDEYNQQRTESAPKIQLKIFDDEATPTTSASTIKSLAHSDVIAVLGPANSAATSAVIELLHVQHLRIPVISALSTATKLTEGIETNYFLRANVSDRKRLSTLLGLIFNDDRLKPRRMIAFYERADAFGEGMLTDAKSWLRNNDRNFLENDLLELGYPRDVSPTDAAQLVADANAKGFGAKNDSILLLGIAQDAITFINVLRMKNVQSRIFFNEPDYLVFKAAADRHIPIAGVRVLSVYWPESAIVNAFHESFQKKFNEEPSFSAALAYDAARIVLRAIDVALGGPARPNDIQTLRDHILENMHKDAGPSLDYVLTGDHRFEKDEYQKLDFQGLQYNSRGELIQWNQNPVQPDQIKFEGQEKPIILPPLYDLALVIVFGFIGSTIREFSRQPPENFWRFLARLPSPISLIVDPAISLIVFGCVFLLTILTRRSLLEIGGDALLIYNVASAALGAISGFMGIRALFAVIKRMGINIQEQDLFGSGVKDATPHP
jgi:branched-chain amino acid transport system substrate-binding protein